MHESFANVANFMVAARRELEEEGVAKIGREKNGERARKGRRKRERERRRGTTKQRERERD